MPNQYCVYILTNLGHTTLYTGVTNNLKRRVYEHKEKLVEGFTKKYHLSLLVYYEVYDTPTVRLPGRNRSKPVRAARRSP